MAARAVPPRFVPSGQFMATFTTAQQKSRQKTSPWPLPLPPGIEITHFDQMLVHITVIIMGKLMFQFHFDLIRHPVCLS